MNKNINIAEILKDAPKGTKLWSPIFGECKLLYITFRDYSINVSVEENDSPSFTFMSDGRYADYPNAECLLFPSKYNRDWKTFKVSLKHNQRKDVDWKDGDILIRKDNNNLFCVYQKPTDNGKGFLCHVYVTKDVLFTGVIVPTDPTDNYRKATDTEKSTFYSLINNHNLSWEAEKKQLIDKEELPKQWEDGDILIRKDRIEYTVFRKYSCTTMFYNYDFLISTDEDNNIWSSLAGKEHLYKTENFRLATSEEIKQFYDLLHKMNEDWDSEKKHLVKLKQKPTLSIFFE